MVNDPQGDELIGREREEGELRALAAQARVLLVYGAAGVGKTSLVLRALSSPKAGLPPVVHVPLPGVGDEREALERTARAIGEPRPAPTPPRVARELVEMLTRTPRTVVWDDLDERSADLAPMARAFADADGPARLVIVSRRYISAKEATLAAPTYEVRPLSREDTIRLVRILEERRKRTLAEAIAEATGGNPLLVKLALADDAVPSVRGDATSAVRHSIERRKAGAAARVLALLAASGASLDEGEVARAAGKGAREAIDELRKHLLVVREGTRVAITPLAAPIAREVLGEPDDAVWRSLAQIGERTLSASAHDDGALVVAARAYLELGDAKQALALAQEHPLARAVAPTAALERILRDVAAQSRGLAGSALRLLAREQLRVGDYDAAARTLGDVPKAKTRADAERTALLRAEALIRAGEPEAAHRTVDALGARKDENPAISLTRATLAILRGELAAAREALEQMADRTDAIPQLASRRAVQCAGSYLYEERYDLTHQWTTRARAAQKAAGIPVEPVVTILDVHALLGLGEVDRAEQVIAREAAGRPDGTMLEIAALVRRGELLRALELGDAALSALDRRADLLFRSVLARDLARACVGTGQLARAARMMRLAEVGADEPGLAALRPICDAELARLAEAEGDLSRARRRIDRAYARIPESPFVAVDSQAMHGKVPVAYRGSPPVAHAYASLRSAELALEKGHLDAARSAAEKAVEQYARARLHLETARARLALAEACVRLGRAADARTAIALCQEIAAPRGYAPILVQLALVRASLAERAGDLAAAASELADAVALAGEDVDAALADAATRLGVAARSDSSRKPYEAIIQRLGLTREADVVWRIGARAYLTGKGEAPPEPVACVVDVTSRCVVADGDARVELPEQRLALLCALAEAGDEGATLEELFVRVWRGTFHPLRHRNAVYVALTRLKETLKPFAEGVQVAHDGDRYRLAGSLPVGVRRRADRAGMVQTISGGSDPSR